MNNHYSQLNEYYDTQKDIILLQKDLGRKIYGVNEGQIINQNSLKNRLLEYNEIENRSDNNLYSYLKFIFFILTVVVIIMLLIKLN